MPAYEITSVRGGISDYENRGIEGSFKFASGIDIRKDVDSISCQQGLVDETGVTFSGTIHWFVVATDGNTYGFDNVGKIYKRDTNKEWSLVYTDPDGAILGAEEWPSDDGKTWLVWATATKLKCKELPGLSDWSDVNTRSGWPKTDLSSTDWHTMKPAGGDLIIANKANLAALGYDGSYSPNVLDVIPGNVVKTLVERNGRTILGTGKLVNPNKGINAAIDAEVPLAQVGDDGTIFFADMNDTMPANRFPGGGRVNPGGVTLDQDQSFFFEWAQANSLNPDVNSFIDKKAIGGMAIFGVFDATEGKGGIWTYGRKKKNHPFVLNLDYPFDADEIGAVKLVGNEIIFSYRIGSTKGVKRVDVTSKGVGIYEGLDRSAPTKLNEQITNWKTIELSMKPLPAGCSVEFWYRMNKQGSFVQATLEDQSNQYSTEGGELATFFIGASGKIYEPRIVLNPSGNLTPEVYFPIVTYFE